MDTLDYDFFHRQLAAGMSIDETAFYFADDAEAREHYLGYLPQYDKPYWVGYCDIPDGTEFKTADALVNAPIYDGRSLKERWVSVRIHSIEGCSLENWLMFFPHV